MNRYFSLLLMVALAFGAACKPAEEEKASPVDTSGSAATLDGTWSIHDLPIPYHISSSVPSSYRAAIVDSFDKWEEAAGVDLFEYKGEIESEVGDLGSEWSHYDDMNVVYWNAAEDGSDHAGKTYYKRETNGQNIEADIVFFGDSVYYSELNCKSDEKNCDVAANHLDIRTTALHEIGHLLGFAHRTDETVMNPDFGFGTVRHDFGDVVVEKLEDLYSVE